MLLFGLGHGSDRPNASIAHRSISDRLAYLDSYGFFYARAHSHRATNQDRPASHKYFHLHHNPNRIHDLDAISLAHPQRDPAAPADGYAAADIHADSFTFSDINPRASDRNEYA